MLCVYLSIQSIYVQNELKTIKLLFLFCFCGGNCRLHSVTSVVETPEQPSSSSPSLPNPASSVSNNILCQSSSSSSSLSRLSKHVPMLLTHREQLRHRGNNSSLGSPNVTHHRSTININTPPGTPPVSEPDVEVINQLLAGQKEQLRKGFKLACSNGSLSVDMVELIISFTI